MKNDNAKYKNENTESCAGGIPKFSILIFTF